MGSESHVGSSRAQQEKKGPQEPDETEGSCWVLLGNRMACRVHTLLWPPKASDSARLLCASLFTEGGKDDRSSLIDRPRLCECHARAGHPVLSEPTHKPERPPIPFGPFLDAQPSLGPPPPQLAGRDTKEGLHSCPLLCPEPWPLAPGPGPQCHSRRCKRLRLGSPPHADPRNTCGGRRLVTYPTAALGKDS